MDCVKIKALFTDYISHHTSDEVVQVIEEHLCVCDACRKQLNTLLEKKDNPMKEEGVKTLEHGEKEIPFEKAAEKERDPLAGEQVESGVFEKRSAFFLYFIFAVAIIFAVFLIFLFLRY